MPRRLDPPGVAPALRYWHGAEVAPNSRFVYSAGQVGRRPDGTIPEDFSEQVENCYRNLGCVLTDAGMSFDDIVKITVFVTKRENVYLWREIRDRLLGDIKPCSTFLVVSSLSEPEYQIEIEAVAAKV